VGRAGGNQHVIDFRWQSKKERPKGRKIVCVERGATQGIYFVRDFLEPFGVSGGDNDLSTLGSRPPCGFESDSG
jgi:hypothetical protein